MKILSRTSTVVSLWLLLAVVSSAYLHRVPGLMGDEASEGENVYELLTSEMITIQGERSYIGPALDYVRVPFMGAFGYTALGVRVPMLLVSLATFALGWYVFKRFFGEPVALTVLAVTFFSPVYLTYQRLGWAITLFPFFALLLLAIVLSRLRYKPLLVGLVAGLALHNHILFLPTLAGVAAGALGWLVCSRNWKAEIEKSGLGALVVRFLTFSLLTVVGFWAGFGTQFVVLQFMTDDQGSPDKVAELVAERWQDLPEVLPLVVSGSSFVARYTGAEFPPLVVSSVTWLVAGLALIGVVLAWRRLVVWLWVGGLGVHLAVLLFMIDRFALRYFVILVLGLWVLAGVGVGELVVRVSQRWRWPEFVPLKAIGISVFLTVLWLALVLVPFLQTGGSVADFSLGNRTDSAAALVDVRPLVSCLRGAGAVGTENVHIFNRLQYISHAYPDLVVVDETELDMAQYEVHYRREDSPAVPPEQELCPELAHFIVEKR